MRFLMSIVFISVVASRAAAQGGVPMNTQNQERELSLATFAGGCFWCMESPFDKLSGVVKTIVGYAGGYVVNPTYKQVSAGRTGHAEAVQVSFDPQEISYKELLKVFWSNINPTTLNRQFNDVGTQYRTVIFYHNEEQKKFALESLDELERSKKFDGPIVTQIVPFTEFFPAEDYHQEYYQKSPVQYKFYRFMSGRDNYIERTWGEQK